MWIDEKATILPGVHIGGGVLSGECRGFKKYPSYSIIIGNQIIKSAHHDFDSSDISLQAGDVPQARIQSDIFHMVVGGNQTDGQSVVSMSDNADRR